MPKPNWGWFAVAVVAAITGVWMIQAGYFTQTGSGPPGGLMFAAVALLSVWAFSKAFFQFKIPPRNKD